MFKQLDKMVNKNKRKSLGIYGNIIAGIITGGIFGSFIPNFFLGKLTIKYVSINLLFIWLFLIVLYNIGRHFIAIDKIELKNYKNNFLAGTFASVYVTLMILLPTLYRFTVLIPLSVIFLIIVLYIYNKPKKFRRKQNF